MSGFPGPTQSKVKQSKSSSEKKARNEFPVHFPPQLGICKPVPRTPLHGRGPGTRARSAFTGRQTLGHTSMCISPLRVPLRPVARSSPEFGSKAELGHRQGARTRQPPGAECGRSRQGHRHPGCLSGGPGGWRLSRAGEDAHPEAVDGKRSYLFALWLREGLGRRACLLSRGSRLRPLFLSPRRSPSALEAQSPAWSRGGAASLGPSLRRAQGHTPKGTLSFHVGASAVNGLRIGARSFRPNTVSKSVAPRPGVHPMCWVGLTGATPRTPGKCS